MTRYLLHLIGIALCILLPATPVLAVVMGEIMPRSKLFQPLSATIPLLGVTAAERDQITATLASPEEFKQADLDWHPYYRNITPQITIGSDGKLSIHLRTQAAIHEPILQFLLKLATSKETVLKSYTLFLDPPIPARQQEDNPSNAADQVATVDGKENNTLNGNSPRDELIKKGLLRGNIYGPVRNGDRISLIAQRTRQNNEISLNQLMLSILKANPDAFEQGNLNKLKRGAMLKLPTEQEALKIDKKQAAQLVLNHSLKRQPAASPHQPSTRQPSSPHTEIPAKKPPHHREMEPEQKPILQITDAPTPKPLMQSAPAEHPSEQASSADTLLGKNDQRVQTALNSLQEQFEKTKQILILQTDLIEAAERIKQTRARANSNLKQELQQQSRKLHHLEQQLQKLQNLKTTPTTEQIIDATWKRYEFYIWGLLAFSLLFGISLVWLAWHRTHQPGSSTPAQQPTPSIKPRPVLQKATKSPASHLAMADNSIDLDYSEDTDTSITSTPTSPASEETKHPNQTSTSKPGKSSQIGDINLKEIDVRLSYRRFEQCVEMLERAIARQPNTPKLMLKMLETHVRAGNKKAFSAHAAKYKPLLSKNDWKRVITMAKSMGLDESTLDSPPSS